MKQSTGMKLKAARPITPASVQLRGHAIRSRSAMSRLAIQGNLSKTGGHRS